MSKRVFTANVRQVCLHACVEEMGGRVVQPEIQPAHPGFRLHFVSLGTRKQTTNTQCIQLPKHHITWKSHSNTAGHCVNVNVINKDYIIIIAMIPQTTFMSVIVLKLTVTINVQNNKPLRAGGVSVLSVDISTKT